MGEAVAAIRLTSLLASHHVPVRVEHTSFLAWNQARNENLIVFGHSESTPWVDRLIAGYPLRTEASNGTLPKRITVSHPKSGECPMYTVDEKHPDDQYVLVSMVPGIDGEHRLLAISGLSGMASQFGFRVRHDSVPCRRTGIGTLQAAGAKSDQTTYFQVILRVSVRNNTIALKGSIEMIRIIERPGAQKHVSVAVRNLTNDLYPIDYQATDTEIPLSEFITHTAVFEDCGRLALFSPVVCDPFKSVLKKYWDIASLGTLLPDPATSTPCSCCAVYCRDHWPTRKDGDFLEEKLAYVIGWRCHCNAADRHFKPISTAKCSRSTTRTKPRRAGDPDERDVSDVRIYHDVIVFREVYDWGRRGNIISPYLVQDNLDGHPAAGARRGRAPGECHRRSRPTHVTGNPVVHGQRRKTACDAWLKRFQKQLQDYYVDVHPAHAQSVEGPQTDYLRRFALENHLYDKRDPLIRLARALQTGTPHSDIHMDTALEQAQKQSQYAQTLRQGYGYLLASSEFFERKIDETELRLRLDLGTAHYQKLGGDAQPVRR